MKASDSAINTRLCGYDVHCPSTVFDSKVDGKIIAAALRYLAAMLCGECSGAGTGTEAFKGIGQSSGGTTRVTNTVDANGNRTAQTLNL